MGSFPSERRNEGTPLSGEPDPRENVLLAVNDTSLLAIILGCVAVGYAFPFPQVKYGIAAFFAILLATQLVRRPAMALAMIAFGMPATGLIPPDIIPIPGLNAETIVILALLAIWARANQLDGPDTFHSGISRALMVYAILIVASSAMTTFYWSASAGGVLASAKNHLSSILFFPVALHVVRDRRDRWMVFMACSLVICLNAIQAIEHSWLAFFTGSLERYRAGAIISPQPNIFGAFLILYLPVFVALAGRRIAKPAFNLWCLFLVGATSFALLLTLSRASWVGLVVSLAVMALFWDRRLLVIFVILAATHTYWLPQEAVERVETTTQRGSFEHEVGDQIADDSTQMRIEQYKSLPAMMAPRPLLGHGYGSFSRVFARYGTLGRPKGAHSTYCLIATEQGVVGLVIFGALFFVILRRTVGAARRVEDPLTKWMAIGLACSVAGGLVAMAGGERFSAQIIWIYFWIMLAMVERELQLTDAGEIKPDITKPAPGK